MPENDELDATAFGHKTPVMADFLVAYSTPPGFYSWRNTSKGSCFIQTFCDAFQECGKSLDFVSVLTKTAYEVAYKFKSDAEYAEGKKQIPFVMSMLRKDLFFTEVGW